MNQQRVYRQIQAILEGNDLEWTERNDVIFLRFASAGVRIDLLEWGSQTVIQLRSDVLSGVSLAAAPTLLGRVNELNTTVKFGRWVYYPDGGIVSLEYDLLGNHLQENELMTALAALARFADYHDDALQSEYGGSRSFDT